MRGPNPGNRVHGQFAGRIQDRKEAAFLLPMTEFGDAMKLPFHFPGLISGHGLPPLGAGLRAPRRPR